MTTIVSGHGEDPDGGMTFVPRGQTVRMYTEHTVNLRNDVALMAILDGARQPGKQITGGEIENYELHTQDDSFVAEWTVLADGSVKILSVGNELPGGIRLCARDNPDDIQADCTEAGQHRCLDGTVRTHEGRRQVPATCEPFSLGRHICSGVLGVLSAETDIVLLACRGETAQFRKGLPDARKGSAHDDRDKPGLHLDTAYDFDVAQLRGEPPQRNPASGEAPGPADPGASPFDYVGRRITRTSPDQQAVAEAEAYIDRLPESTMGLLHSYPAVRHWLCARWIKVYAEQGKVTELAGQLASNVAELEDITSWLTRVPWYGDALDRVLDQDAFWQEAGKLDPGVQTKIMTILGDYSTKKGAPAPPAGSNAPAPAQGGLAERIYDRARQNDLPGLFAALATGPDLAVGALEWLVTNPGYGQTVDRAARANAAEFWEEFRRADPVVQRALLERRPLFEVIDQHLQSLSAGNPVRARTLVADLPEPTRGVLCDRSSWLGAWFLRTKLEDWLRRRVQASWSSD